MMIKLKTVYPLAVFLLLQMGCSAQKKEGTSVGKNEKQAVASDTSFNLQENKETDVPLVTLIELGSVKCIPCKMMQPIIEEIEKEYADQVKVVFYDVWTDEGKPYAEKYGIRSIPTQVFLDQNGVEYFRHTGFFPKEDIVKVFM